MSFADDEQDGARLAELLVAVGTRRDTAAFEELFRHFAPRVKAYMGRLGGAADAESLMQETMVRVWRRSAQFEPARGTAAGWVFTIARNLRIDALRRQRRPEFDPTDPAFVPDDEPPADARLEQAETADLMRDALGALPDDQSQILRLAFLEGLTHQQVAARLAIPIGTVKTKIYRGLARLRAALGEAEN